MYEIVKRWSLVSVIGLGLSSIALASPMADKIRTFADGGSGDWDAKVKEVLLPAYDSDGSGTLDTPAEVKSVACDVWKAIDAGVKQQYASGVYTTYGFSPDTMWVGYTLGFDEGMRAAAGVTAKNCLGVDGADAGTKPSGGSVGAQIRGLSEAGGSSEWDAAVKLLLLGAHDANGSGSIDSAGEVSSIPCDTWQALNSGVKAGWDSGIFIIYGFKPDLIWVGYAIGVSEEVRGAAAAALRNCALGDGEAGAPATGGVADRVAALPDAGSSEWDTAVKAILVEQFDKNGSGELDKKGEIDAIPCDVFNVLDKGVRDGWGAGIRSIYGFDDGYIWVGYAIGVSESMRAKAAERATTCGLTN